MSLPLRAKVLAKRAQLRHFFEGVSGFSNKMAPCYKLYEMAAADGEGILSELKSIIWGPQNVFKGQNVCYNVLRI